MGVLLSKEEAVCFVLHNSRNNVISGKTKLNKEVARLNFFMIPQEVKFKLNQYGSMSEELTSLKNTPFYRWETPSWSGSGNLCLKLTSEGENLYGNVESKLKLYFNDDELTYLKREINRLSGLNATDISADEHSKLMVDIEDREFLKQSINQNNVELLDIYTQIKQMDSDSYEKIILFGLIEFSYYLSCHLKNKLNRLNDGEYDFDANMEDYYLIWIESKNLIPLFNEQLRHLNNPKKIIRAYEFMHELTEDYPFSINNPDLIEIIARC